MGIAAPWLTIWLKPRATIRHIIAAKPKQHVILLAILAGILNALDRSSANNLGDRWSYPAVLLTALLMGPLRGLISLYLSGAVLYWTGRLFGGAARPVEVRAAIAWSSVPLIWAGLLWLPELALAGEELFTRSTPRIDNSPFLGLVLMGFSLIEIVITAWAAVILVNCLAEAHHFSAWRALGAVLLPGVVIGLVVSVIVFLM